MTETPLDAAHWAMEDSQGEAARLAYYNALLAAELFVVLEAEAEGEVASPRLFPLETAPTVLAFDTEERLASLSEGGAPVPHATLSGRNLVAALAGQDVALGINLGGEGAAFLLDSEGLGWLAETMAVEPDPLEARIAELHPPAAGVEALVQALDRALASVQGQAARAYLARAIYAGGGQGHVLAVIDVVPGAEEAMTQVLGEALRFSGLEAGALDIGFWRAAAPMVESLERVGLRFDLPEPPEAEGPVTPGRDPENPPILR